MRSQYLCTIIPIGLITVIFFRVMRSCQDDTALTSQMTNGKRHLRSGTHILKQIYLDTISRENICWDFGKQTAVVTAIMTNHNSYLFKVFKVLIKIVGQSLSSCTDSIYIHTVTTYSHDTAQTACTKFQIFIKCFYQIGFIFIFQHTLYLCLSFGIVCRS